MIKDHCELAELIRSIHITSCFDKVVMGCV
jgi:hypothetical protein